MSDRQFEMHRVGSGAVVPAPVEAVVGRYGHELAERCVCGARTPQRQLSRVDVERTAEGVVAQVLHSERPTLLDAFGVCALLAHETRVPAAVVGVDEPEELGVFPSLPKRDEGLRGLVVAGNRVSDPEVYELGYDDLDEIVPDPVGI